MGFIEGKDRESFGIRYRIGGEGKGKSVKSRRRIRKE